MKKKIIGLGIWFALLVIFFHFAIKSVSTRSDNPECEKVLKQPTDDEIFTCRIGCWSGCDKCHLPKLKCKTP